jgi:thiosulfate/3-mercaptopyruvate sulfurtransferase
LVTIIDPLWLQRHLTEATTVTLDPRPIVKYLEGHIPRAVNLPMTKLLDPKTLALMPPKHLYGLIGAAGLDENSTAVLYDGYDGQSAAMLAWVLEYLGHPRVVVLSCRLEGWADHGGELLYKPVRPQTKKFDARLNNALRAQSGELLQKGNIKLIDLRSREEYEGKVATEIRTGHIPGAVNLPWIDLIGGGQEYLRALPDLKEVVERIGVRPTDKVVTYCSHGPRAAIGYLALQHLGYKVGVYDGSFHEWAQHQELPVEGEGLQIQL